MLLLILLHSNHEAIPKELNKHAGYVCTVFLVDIHETSTKGTCCISGSMSSCSDSGELTLRTVQMGYVLKVAQGQVYLQ